ncbi:Cul3, partial [Symbiodinium sp. KB8]
ESQALNVLRKAINTIFEQKSSSLSFEHLYRNAYNLVLNKKSEALYRMVEEALTDNIKSIGANAVFDAEDEILLPRLIETWKTVRWTVKSVANVLMYLDRTYINERHSDNLLPVFLLGITVFKNVVFMYPRVRDRFRGLVLEAISRERNGEVVDHTLLNGAAQMLVDMEDGKLGLYEQEFEREFLKMSEQYFHGLALKFLSMTVPEFLRKVEETLADEEMRLGTYLAETTRPKLMKLFNLEMLEVHAKAVIE